MCVWFGTYLHEKAEEILWREKNFPTILFFVCLFTYLHYLPHYLCTVVLWVVYFYAVLGFLVDFYRIKCGVVRTTNKFLQRLRSVEIYTKSSYERPLLTFLGVIDEKISYECHLWSIFNRSWWKIFWRAPSMYISFL